MTSRALVLMVVVAGACFGPPVADDKPAVCTQVGCRDIASARLELALTPAEVARTTLTVCRNGTCNTGPGPAEPIHDLPGPLEIRLFAEPIAGTSGTRLWITIIAIDPKDGDRYSIRISPPDRPDETLLSVDKAVTYATYMPNGPKCAPTCHTASIAP